MVPTYHVLFNVSESGTAMSRLDVYKLFDVTATGTSICKPKSRVIIAHGITCSETAIFTASQPAGPARRNLNGTESRDIDRCIVAKVLFLMIHGAPRALRSSPSCVSVYVDFRPPDPPSPVFPLPNCFRQDTVIRLRGGGVDGGGSIGGVQVLGLALLSGLFGA